MGQFEAGLESQLNAIKELEDLLPRYGERTTTQALAVSADFVL